MDIGGGSSEIVIGNKNELIEKQSFNVGAVRLTERFFSQGITKQNLSLAKTVVLENLRTAHFDTTNVKSCYGVAGTLTTLAQLSQGLPNFDASKIHRYPLTFEQVSELSSFLFSATTTDIINLGVAKGRADILAAGALILQTIMEELSLSVVRASIYGLRYGVLIEET